MQVNVQQDIVTPETYHIKYMEMNRKQNETRWILVAESEYICGVCVPVH